MWHRIVKKRGHRIANTASAVCYGISYSISLNIHIITTTAATATTTTTTPGPTLGSEYGKPLPFT